MKYVKPSISVYEIGTEVILAGSGPKVKAQIDGDEDGEGLEYGGETEQDGTYVPW